MIIAFNYYTTAIRSLGYIPLVRAKVRERRQAQRQARQAKSKKKNRYVIKVMNEHREGEQFLKFARPKVVRHLLIG